MMLVSMAFDEGDCVLEFRRCLFEYNGREFMLYPGNNKRYMSIDTVVLNEQDDDIAFEQIHEFLYLFGWENQCHFHFLNSSAMSGDRDLLLRRQEPLMNIPRRMYNITRFLIMSDPNTSDDFKKAIALYNDARHTQDVFYRFFCLYKILDLPVSGKTRNPEKWINDNIDKVTSVDHSRVASFINDHSNFGEFMRDECRNALAHIHRADPNKKSILPYKSSDYMRIVYGNAVLQDLALYFIKNEIGEPTSTAINIMQVEQ